MTAAPAKGGTNAITGMRCGGCGLESAPVQPVCPHCGGDRRLETVALPPRGSLYSFTIVHVAPAGLEAEAPYALGIVELEGGARMTARVRAADPADLVIGMPLRLSEIRAGVCFFDPA